MHKRWPFWLTTLLTFVWGVEPYLSTLNVEAKPPPKVVKACRVLRIHDGDTLKTRCGLGSNRQRELKVRLYCIDAPELAQAPWGKIARDHLRRLVGQGPVQIWVKDRDDYGRTVGEVWRGSTNLNLAMVKAGRVAVYRHYCGVAAYQQAEAVAKSRRLGVWAKPGLHQQPWEWRQ